ncbi:unnamed protein product [marine sediment metagenome]|uniref:Uncharacterized protein n=1 Tax=marine sediment metagenome TaxID=412755 RepID=X1G5S6_9ZZZZ
MSKHYKKLFLLLIPACSGFCLALALGSAEQPIELCHLCQNKALVKAAILAGREHPEDPNLPDQFDPNYVQASLLYAGYPPEYVNTSPVLGPPWHLDMKLEFKSIIAEGDMVSVIVTWGDQWGVSNFHLYFQQGTYRIANGKIVEGWISRFTLIAFQNHLPFLE